MRDLHAEMIGFVPPVLPKYAVGQTVIVGDRTGCIRSITMLFTLDALTGIDVIFNGFAYRFNNIVSPTDVAEHNIKPL